MRTTDNDIINYAIFVFKVIVVFSLVVWFFIRLLVVIFFLFGKILYRCYLYYKQRRQLQY